MSHRSRIDIQKYFFISRVVTIWNSLPECVISAPSAELQIIFTVVSVFTKENFNPFSNLLSLFSIGTHEIQWLFSIFLTHNWSPIYLLL